jgi:hypothetical protein
LPCAPVEEWPPGGGEVDSGNGRFGPAEDHILHFLNVDLRCTDGVECHTAAHRPKFSAPSSGKMEKAGLAPMPPLEEALKHYFARRAKLVGAT